MPDVWADLETEKKFSFGKSKNEKNRVFNCRCYFFGGLCIGITWLLGALFGPLYHGEEESSRNFGIFLYSFFAFVIGGAIAGYVIAKK
jgi:hypothetical protein